MQVRTVKMNRTIKQKNNEIFISLEATDILTKEDFVEIYDNRIQEKVQLENNIAQYREYLSKVKSYEKEEGIKEISNLINKDKEFAQKLYAILQKKVVTEQLQVWEKALEGMNKELEDLGPMYKKLKEETKDTKSKVFGGKK